MTAILQQIALAAPLFVLVFVGYAISRWGGWPKAAGDALARFVFSIALPAMLFRLMSGFGDLPPVDMRLLAAFFGGCLVVFVFGRLLSSAVFRLDGVSQSVFALGGVFSNNVLLGLPLTRVLLGEEALPAAALVIVFNALILWTLVTVSVEWARQGALTLAGFGKTARGVLTNPLVASILSGTVFGLLGLRLPPLVDQPVRMLGDAALPMSLVALGMGLAEFGMRKGWHLSASISVLKLFVHPLVVWLLARALALPAVETQAVVLLASLSVGANVYLMSRQFDALQGPVASSLLMSTALASLTTPLMLALVRAFPSP
ncbi:AEC family transporter [Methyloversatilis thermotolerans]|uniref:AEC family transporter n=1 Tax=Methyloversatilis thermotolerans TaxID=1346290 RepID=UPI0003758193|nr:AEC family transporter [Methyloversatilis thermotolerans]